MEEEQRKETEGEDDACYSDQIFFASVMDLLEDDSVGWSS